MRENIFCGRFQFHIDFYELNTIQRIGKFRKCSNLRPESGGAGVANKLERPLSVETQICVHGTYLHFVFQCSVVTNG